MKYSWLMIAVMAWAVSISPNRTPESSAATGPDCAAITHSELCPIIESGRLAGLRWPDFSDYRIEVRSFYLPYDYALAWTRDKQPTPQARAMIQLFQDADKKGLHAEDYDGPFWNDRVARLVPPAPSASPADLAHFDLAVTVSAMRYVSALHHGRVNPRRLQFGLSADHTDYDLAEFLRKQVVEAADVSGVLAQVEPASPGYRLVEAALERYQALAREGEGEPLPRPRKRIKPGDQYPGVPQLAQRLRRMGDLSPQAADSIKSENYEGGLVEGVKHFQQRHGLPADGILDPETFNQIVTPFARRVMQLQFTLERWRWVPRKLPPRFIVVNVPEFLLRAYDNHRMALSMKVVVGKAFRENQTPIFQDEMEYVLFRPPWNVPASITRKEVIPAIAKHPGYLEKHEFELVNRQGTVIGSDDIDGLYAKLRSGELRVRQRPGPENSLGLIKFVFPNNYDVYMHGTPQQTLFERSRRAFSHGCIRVEDPKALALWVLNDVPSWAPARIEAAMNAEETKRVDLPKPIPVFVLYTTALAGENGEARFFADVYGQDKKLERALSNGYPYPR